MDLEFLVSRWSSESHTSIAAYGEFGPTIGDVSAIILLSMFGNTHAMGIILDEEKEELELLN